MRHKRKIKTKQIYKWKSCLNLHGGQQIYREHFWETYSAIAKWSSIRLLLIVAILMGMYTHQFDFILAYSQADIGVKQWMKIPAGVTLDGMNPKDYVLEVTKNVYGGRDSGLQQFNHLKQGLTDPKVGFKQSEVDPCIFYKPGSIFIVYMDDAIMASYKQDDIEKVYNTLKDTYHMTDEGELTDYLGVNIE